MSNLELNQGDNFIFGIDVSGSMQTADCPGGLTRIEFLKEKVIQFAGEASKYDTDGIDVITFGQQLTNFDGVNGDKAKEVIGKLKAQESATFTDKLITAAFKKHKDGGYKQSVLFVATDGEPSDKAAVKKAIIGITQELKDEHEFAISVLTVGQPSADLTDFLNSLDDDLKGAKYDIVDVKKLEEVDFISAFSGALHD